MTSSGLRSGSGGSGLRAGSGGSGTAGGGGGGGGGGTPTFIGSSGTSTYDATTPKTLALPACAVGDVRVIAITSNGGGTTISATGWTALGAPVGSIAIHNFLYRVKQSGDPDSVAVSATGGVYFSVSGHAYAGTSAAPFGTPTVTFANNTASADPPAITTTANSSLVIYIGTSFAQPWGDPQTGYVVDARGSAGGVNGGWEAAHIAGGSAGSVIDGGALSLANTYWALLAVELKAR